MSPEADRNSVRVNIYNQPYTLSVAGEASEVEELANVVDDLMTEIAQRAGNVDSTRVAVLASLHLADQLRSLERELETLRTRVKQKSREYSLLLDKAIK